jgi:nicotinamidase-related amidase
MATPANTALIVIDVQNAVIAEGAHREAEVLAAISDMAERARAARTPVIYIQHNEDWPAMRKGADGWRIHPAVAPKPGETTIDKTASDSFQDTPLQAELDRLGARRLVLCGLQTDHCVNATVRSAFAKGYDVVLAADAHSTSSGAAVIEAHNADFAALADGERRVELRPASEIAFG